MPIFLVDSKLFTDAEYTLYFFVHDFCPVDYFVISIVGITNCSPYLVESYLDSPDLLLLTV